jgi:hypothetical protein
MLGINVNNVYEVLHLSELYEILPLQVALIEYAARNFSELYTNGNNNNNNNGGHNDSNHSSKFINKMMLCIQLASNYLPYQHLLLPTSSTDNNSCSNNEGLLIKFDNDDILLVCSIACLVDFTVNKIETLIICFHIQLEIQPKDNAKLLRHIGDPIACKIYQMLQDANEMTKDFTIQVKDCVFKVHKSFLRLHSAVVTVMLDAGMQETAKNILKIDHFDDFFRLCQY